MCLAIRLAVRETEDEEFRVADMRENDGDVFAVEGGTLANMALEGDQFIIGIGKDVFPDESLEAPGRDEVAREEAARRELETLFVPGTEELYALLETATLRITLMESVEREQLIEMCDFALDGMKAVSPEERS